MNGDTFLGIGTALLALGAFPLLARSFRNIGGLRIPARESAGSLAALFGAFGVALHAGGQGLLVQAVSLLLIKAGLVLLLLFAHSVFRSGSRGSTSLVVLGLVALGYSLHLDLEAVTRHGIPMDSRAAWIGQLATGFPLAWVALECFLAWRRQALQGTVGLGDPQVRNRFALGMAVGVFLSLVCIVRGFESLGLIAHSVSAWGCGGLSMAAAPALWLIFSPPAAYLAWLTRTESSPA